RGNLTVRDELERGLDRPCRRDRIFRAADRAADDEHAGAVVAGLAGGDDTLLIADGAACEAQAGDDEEAILPLLSNLAYFLAGTDETVEARGVCQFGEAHDLIVRAAFDTGTLEVAFVEACEHRHRDHLGA